MGRMGTDRQYINGSGPYGDVGHSPTQQTFVNIDPLLTMATNAGDTTPSTWCPTWNEPVDIFDAGLSGPYVPTAFPTAQSFSSSNEQSPPKTVLNEAVMIVSQASIMVTDPPKYASSSPPKGRKPRQAKQQRQQEAQYRGQGSRRSSQELQQASSTIKTEAEAEAEEQDGEQDDVEIEEDEETKRSQFLARNRLAASKSRQRKRQWEDNLEARTSEAEHRYLMLKTERTVLLENIGDLKNHIFTHGLCKDPNIDKWLQNQASNFVAIPSKQHDGLSLGDASLSHNS